MLNPSRRGEEVETSGIMARCRRQKIALPTILSSLFCSTKSFQSLRFFCVENFVQTTVRLRHASRFQLCGPTRLDEIAFVTSRLVGLVPKDVIALVNPCAYASSNSTLGTHARYHLISIRMKPDHDCLNPRNRSDLKSIGSCDIAPPTNRQIVLRRSRSRLTCFRRY